MAWTEKLPSGRYRAAYRTPMGQKRSAGTFTHKAKALRAATLAEAESASLGWRDPQAALRTWKEWCDEWWGSRGVAPGTLARDAAVRDAVLLPKWGDVSLSEITRQDVKAWASAMAKAGLAPNTVKRRVYLFSASLNAAIDAEVIQVNPAYKIKLPGGEEDKRHYLTKGGADDLFLQFSPPVTSPTNLAVVSTLLGTGMRWGEMAGLQIKRVDFERGIIRVAEVWDDKLRQPRPYSKGKKIRSVPIPPWLEPELRYAIGGRRSGFVFQPNGFMLDYQNWRRRYWLPATVHAGLEGVHIHDLRHTFASWLIQAGFSLAEVGKLLGHVSPATTQIYAHLVDELPSERIHAALPSPLGH